MFEVIEAVFKRHDVPVFKTEHDDVIRYSAPLTYAVKKAILSEIEERTKTSFVFL